MTNMPALGIVATSGPREELIEIARDAERRGYAGIYVPSMGASMPFCQSVLEATDSIIVGTAIQSIYLQQPRELAANAAYLHDLSGGRFRMGLGVSHVMAHSRHGVVAGKPLADMRDYVAVMHEAAGESGSDLPPIILATLRNKMLKLAGEIAKGAIFGNGAQSYMPHQLATIGVKSSDDFFVGNMLPIVIDDDVEAAAEVHRAASNFYMMLPNYRNYWREAGYADRIDAVEQALAAGEVSGLVNIMGDEWLTDVTLYGPAARVRGQVEDSLKAGITPIIVPSSTSGDTTGAFEEVFAAFS